MKNKLAHIKLEFVGVLVICMFLGTSLILQAETQISQWDYLTPDLLISNRKIITIDENFSIAEVLAIEDNRIVAVGKTVILGLQDSHIHFMELGRDLIYKKNLPKLGVLRT